MKRHWLVGVIVAVIAAVPCVAHAADGGASMGGAKVTLSLTKVSTPSPWTNESGYGNRAVHKLGFGLKNLLLGWTDLFKEPAESMKNGTGFWRGLGYGLKDTVENEVGGVVHVVTFPITGLDAPLPEGGVQL